MTVLLRKEFMEMFRSYRILFVPLIFVLLALGNIILQKMLPDMIAPGAENLPKVTVTAVEVVQKLFTQLDQFGVLVLILTLMGSIAGERASGIMTTVLIKPVSRVSYAGSKLIAALLLTSVSYIAALISSYIYAGFLFDDPLDRTNFILGSALYLPKLLWIAAVVLFFSSMFKSTVAAGSASLVVYMILSFGSSLEILKNHFPTSLTEMAMASFKGEAVDANASLVVTFVLIGLLFAGTCWIITSKER